MQKVLYTKYNSMRRPRFQLKTEILEEDGQRYVQKGPMLPEAAPGIQQLQDNYGKVARLYRGIQALPCVADGERVRFAWLEGQTLLDEVDFTKKDGRDIVRQIDGLLDSILDFCPECRRQQFEMSDAFAKMFPGCFPQPEEEAVGPTNLDGLLDNFIRKDGKIWCIDYEWVFDFAVPVRYLKFRTLLHIYVEKAAYIRRLFDLAGFFGQFGYSQQDFKLFDQMEVCFQKYVQGEGREYYIYTLNYEKKRTTLQELEETCRQVGLKENHIQNLEGLLKEKEEHIQNLEGSLKEKDRLIACKDQEIDEKQRCIEEKNQMLENLGSRIQKLSEVTHTQKVYIDDIHLAMKNPAFAANLVKNKIVGTLRQKFTQGAQAKTAQEGQAGIALEAEGTVETAGADAGTEPEYEMWIEQLESTEKYGEAFAYQPKISVLVPVYNVLDKHLIPCIESVRGQIYKNWELCLADDCSTWENVRATLKRYEPEENIKVAYREQNGHISACTNTALELATGEFVAFLDCDDLLRPNALYEVVKKLNEDRTLDFIYSDEDKVDEDGNHRHMPFFKPDWSPDTLMATMYTCHLGVYRRRLANVIGGMRVGYEGAQDYDFALRFTEKTNRIAHIPKILYHWRERAESTSLHPEAKPYVHEAEKKSKEEALERRGLKARLKELPFSQLCVEYLPESYPLVSIIIPSKDNYAILRQCIQSLDNKTSYRHYEILLIDNGSSKENRQKYGQLAEQYHIRYICQEMEFNFSRMCNIGVEQAKGDIYLFLNDDIEIIHSDWLGSMVGQARLSHVGAVGAKLLYPKSGLIQHAGVINIQSGPVHCFGGYSDENGYYFGRTALTYDVLAVTGACLMVDASKYREVGGFYEGLPVAYNDVDLCFKLYETGYYNVIRNDIVLYHHESVSRGIDFEDAKKMKRLTREREHLYEMHQELGQTDPFYNIMLAQNRADFSYNYEVVDVGQLEG